MDIELRNLGDVIAKCWERAEETTRQAAEEHVAPAEENITFLFEGKLRTAVANASGRREFEEAFLLDIQTEFPDIDVGSFSEFNGLIAQVNLHNRWHEGCLSAADLGVVICRPSVYRVGTNEVQIVRDQRRALLAQAKLGKVDVKRRGRVQWGGSHRKPGTAYPDTSGLLCVASLPAGWQFQKRAGPIQLATLPKTFCSRDQRVAA